MTNAEAIEWLEAIRKKYIHGGDEGFDMKRNEALDLAISALSRDSWISVEERLPERSENVLTAAKGDRVRENFLISAERDEWSYDSYSVTHWMPLPEPPKEDKP